MASWCPRRPRRRRTAIASTTHAAAAPSAMTGGILRSACASAVTAAVGPGSAGDDGARQLRRIDQPADRGARGLGEAPVEQRRALLPALRRHVFGAEQRDDQPAAVAFGGTDVGVPGQVGEAGLAAQRARIAVDEQVLVLDLEAFALLAAAGRASAPAWSTRSAGRPRRRSRPGRSAPGRRRW